MATRRSRSGRGLAASDEALVSMMARLEEMQARIAEAQARRVDMVGEAALACFPEIDAGEYGDDIDEFFTAMRDDALAWREMQAKGLSEGRSAKVEKSDEADVDLSEEL